MLNRNSVMMKNIGKLSLAFLTLILIGYIYLIVIARDNFSNTQFYSLVGLAIVSLGLIFRGFKVMHHSKEATSPAS